MKSSPWVIALILTSVSLVLASCSPIIDARGHNGDAQDVKQLVIGQSTAEDVMALLGSPTSTSSFGDETWYYITQKQERLGVLAPKVTEQQVVAIHFDAQQQVSSIEQYSKEQGKPVESVSKTTPTEGHNLTIMEQLLGNLGRFNSGRSGISDRHKGR